MFNRLLFGRFRYNTPTRNTQRDYFTKDKTPHDTQSRDPTQYNPAFSKNFTNNNFITYNTITTLSHVIGFLPFLYYNNTNNYIKYQHA